MTSPRSYVRGDRRGARDATSVRLSLRALRPLAAGALLLLVAAGEPTQELSHRAPPGARQELPRSALAVRSDGGWHTWWRSDRAPGRWTGPHPLLAGAVAWREAHPGVEWAELRIAGTGEAWRLRLVLVRLEPRRVRLELAQATRAGGMLGAWTVDSLPADALLGLNAGQFQDGAPWGWLVRDGREIKPPGSGPLSMAVVVDSSGRARLVPADSIATVRERGGVAQAFQSYPALLNGNGEVPAQLRGRRRGVDVAHRDSRLALGELRDGRLLLVLTRFEGLNGVLSALPFGPTTPETAAIMGALGARRAVMLDGGISGQLRLRAGGELHTWRGMRRVPLGLLARPRD